MSAFDFENGELILVDKPLNWTSFDVVGKIRNSTRIKKIKVGHAGTLDPLATGLLIICTGKLTKKVDEFLAEEKEYTGTITLGATTPSYDLETEINHTFPTDHITEEMIAEAAKTFEGEIEQVSPLYSALRIDGERAYHKARRGEEVKMKARKVRIEAFEVTKIEMPIIHFRIVCSKGTYIRSIAHDIGKILQSGSHLSSLRRTRSGNFKIEDAWNLESLIEKIKTERFEKEKIENNS
jgi:tRNA pseudouridine55 synthase